MIEAVNSVLSNASSTRASVEQQSTVRSYAANPQKIQEIPASSIRQRILIDNNLNRAIIEIRDNSSGDVVRQFPTEGQLKAYRTAQAFTKSRERVQDLADLVESSSSSRVEQAPLPEVSVPEISESAPVEVATQDVTVPSIQTEV